MRRSDHLDDGALMRLLDGVEDADAAPGLAEMREHVADCSGCRARLGELAEGDRLWKGALAGSSRLQAPVFEVGRPGRGRDRRRLLAVAAVLAVLAAVPPVRAAVGSGWGWIREHLAPAAMVETPAVSPSPSAEVGEDAVESRLRGAGSRWTFPEARRTVRCFA